LEGGGIIFDPYQKNIHFNKRENITVGGPTLVAYQNGTIATTKNVVIY
jgi:hypothetical protein